MLEQLRPAVALTIAFTALTGLAYPLAIIGIGQVAAPIAANGSPVARNGVTVGSTLIGQSFSSDRYFHGRPSGAGANGYDAAASSGTNLAPSSTALRDAIAERAAAVGPLPAPADLVTASGSGLDPHVSPAAALAQISRVAAARNVPEADLRLLIGRIAEGRQFGVLGEPRVNVLMLNLELDQLKP